MEATTQVQEKQVTGRPGSAAKLIREVRAKTRRKFLAEDKIRIVLEKNLFQLIEHINISFTAKLWREY